MEEFACWEIEENLPDPEEVRRIEQLENEMKNLQESEEHIQRAWNFYNEILKKPKHWSAPMVGCSELAFRMLTRFYGADICSTPMIAASGYVASEHYRAQFTFAEEDRPLIVQFCGDHSKPIIEAAKLVENYCDAIEINLGCPQQCAKSGHYGAFLMDSPLILYEMVSNISKAFNKPLLCKVRIFKNYEKTLKMCRLLQNAGCYILTIHGRTKEEKRSGEHLANWQVIKQLKRDLRIPVISNGNIRDYNDIEHCFGETMCDGVMSATSLLVNPALFSSKNIPPFQLAEEYLEYARKYRATVTQIRKHIFYILRKPLNNHQQFQAVLLELESDHQITDEIYDALFNIVQQLKTLETEQKDEK